MMFFSKCHILKFVTITLGLMANPAWGQNLIFKPTPEFTTGWQQSKAIIAKKFMIVAANPLATKAGYDILKKGGSAIDAMITSQMVLGLVEPQSSGLGGGAFLVYHDNKTNKTTTFDGRETAPLAVTPALFLKPDGTPLKFFDAVVGGLSVGTPGTLMLMFQAHKKYGKLPWKQLFQPAISLAQNGFNVSPRLASLIAKDQMRLAKYPDTRAYFFTSNGNPLPVGSLLKNPAYAETLRMISTQGPTVFYQGIIAKDIATKVQRAENNPGTLSIQDLAAYRVIERPAVCLTYRRHNVCGMGPPSSGALTVGQILGQLRSFNLQMFSAPSVHLIAESSRLAFADRGLYMADSDVVEMPTKGLLDERYLKDRALLIDPKQASKTVTPGNPPWPGKEARAKDGAIEFPSTSHMSIIDQDGNAVSLTTTIENGFGSRLMVRGFLLNNELTDFSFIPERNGIPVANRVEAGKRPRSSMSPTLVYGPDGHLKWILGSPGGSRIIGYVAQTIIALLDWNMTISKAVAMPHVVDRFGTIDLERGMGLEKMAQDLTALGHKTKFRDLNSGLHIIAITKTNIQGAADPRREGIALGD